MWPKLPEIMKLGGVAEAGGGGVPERLEEEGRRERLE